MLHPLPWKKSTRVLLSKFAGFFGDIFLKNQTRGHLYYSTPDRQGVRSTAVWLAGPLAEAARWPASPIRAGQAGQGGRYAPGPLASRRARPQDLAQ